MSRPADAVADAPIRSPWRIFLGRLARNRAALGGAALLALLYLAATFGSFIGPYDPERSRRQSPNHRPTTIRFVDKDGDFHWRPFIYRTRMTDILRRTYVVETDRRYPIRFFVRGDPYKLWWLFESNLHLFGVGAAEGGPALADGEAPPPAPPIYLFGSDGFGRDVFSRLLAGAKISLSVGLIGIAITMTLGMLVGGISGYLGGLADAFIMRSVELLMSIPGLYLILALRAAFHEENPLLSTVFGLEEGQKPSSGQMYIMIVAILGLIGWAGAARVIRGMVLAIKKLDYVAAARAMGASPLRIITRHLLPNTLTYVIISATLSIPAYILGEVVLSFLGVGIEEPQASWGNMLHEAQNIRTLTEFTWMLWPGFFIFVTVFAFNFFGDGVRDALDPRYLK